MGDLSEDKISNKEDKKFDIELRSEASLLTNKNMLFYSLGGLIVIMFIAAFVLTYKYIFQLEPSIANACKDINITVDSNIKEAIKNNSISSAILIGTTLMIPTILSLAMMRFLFGNKNDKGEKNIPSIIFNIGKELQDVLIAVFKK